MSATKQPVWKFIANLGDVTPLDYGGYFVYADATGVYGPEAELLEEPAADDDSATYTVYGRECDSRPGSGGATPWGN